MPVELLRHTMFSCCCLLLRDRSSCLSADVLWPQTRLPAEHASQTRGAAASQDAPAVGDLQELQAYLQAHRSWLVGELTGGVTGSTMPEPQVSLNRLEIRILMTGLLLSCKLGWAISLASEKLVRPSWSMLPTSDKRQLPYPYIGLTNVLPRRCRLMARRQLPRCWPVS